MKKIIKRLKVVMTNSIYFYLIVIKIKKLSSFKKTLENLGFRVYVDWINDKFFQEDVDKKTAALYKKE